MFIEIISPEETLFSGEAKSIKLPGTGGTFEVLENHAPLISTLDAGQIRIRKTSGEDQTFNISHGFVEVLKNKVSVLV